MSKKFGLEFPVSATLFQKLEKEGWRMQSGDVHLRQSLESLTPVQGSRSAWFIAVGQRVGIPARRVKSLFYNRGCRLWGDELARITSAIAKAEQQKAEELQRALNAHADRRVMGEQLEAIKGELRREIVEDIGAMLLELLNSGHSLPAGIPQPRPSGR